jgi:hypothetical protein
MTNASRENACIGLAVGMSLEAACSGGKLCFARSCHNAVVRRGILTLASLVSLLLFLAVAPALRLTR